MNAECLEIANAWSPEARAAALAVRKLHAKSSPIVASEAAVRQEREANDISRQHEDFGDDSQHHDAHVAHAKAAELHKLASDKYAKEGSYGAADGHYKDFVHHRKMAHQELRKHMKIESANSVTDYIANLKPGVSLVEAANAGTSEGATKGWEHRDRHGNAWRHQNGVTMKTSSQGHNVTAIDHKGSPKTTQVWDGGHQAAAKTVLDWHASGEANKSKGGGWDEPVLHAYIHSHEHKETHHFDMSNPSHVKALKEMAGAK